ncbi:MAG: hypothetical protein ACEQSK_08295 [Sphingomonadaceae bacterium]
MRRALGQSLRIEVAPHAVSLLRLSRWRGAPVTPLARHVITASAEHPFDAIAQALRALLGELELRSWPVSFVLADELTRLWQVTPPTGATRMADLEAAAALRFQSLYGEAPGAWQFSADWNTRQSFFAAAVPRTLLAELQQVADEFKLSVVAITPHFVSAWNRWQPALKPDSWYGLVHDGVLTLALVAAATRRGGQLKAVRALPLPADASPAWLAQTVQREALLHNLSLPARLQASGALPASWTHASGQPGAIACVALDGSL